MGDSLNWIPWLAGDGRKTTDEVQGQAAVEATTMIIVKQEMLSGPLM
jgi:hypothetical protein